MEQHPKDKILVLSNNDPSQLPLSQALQDLGYLTEYSRLSEISPSLDSDTHAIILIPDESGTATLDATIACIQEAWDAPILITDCELPPGSFPIQTAHLGASQIPASLSGKSLDCAIARAHEFHSLHSQLEHYRKLLQGAPVGVFKIADGKMTYVNDYLLERTGYTMEQIRTLRLEEFFVPEDRLRFIEAMKELPLRPSDAPPNVYRFLALNGQTFVGEIRSKVLSQAGKLKIEGTIRDITQETRIMQLHRIVLELTEVILAEHDIDKILQLVLDTIVEYSGFRRALLTLYDLSIPVPFEGDVYKMLTSGLTLEEKEAILAKDPIPIRQRKAIYSDRFKLGSAYYIPHDKTPWLESHGITGTVAVEGWHPDDYLFIPLRGIGGIIGSISVDDPVDHNVPTVASIEPVAFLANFAAFAVERVFKLRQMQKQADQLHGLAALGAELAKVNNERSLCEIAAERVQESMDYDVCGIYLLDGMRFVHEAVAARDGFPQTEISEKGTRVIAKGPGINRWVLQHGEPAIIPDVSKNPIYDGTRETIRSYIAMPIHGRKGTIGVIYTACQRLAAFGDQDLEILSTVASHLATALSALRRRSALNRIFSFGQQLAVASTESQAITSTLDFLVAQFDFQLSSILMLQEDGTLRVDGVGGAYSETRISKGWKTTKDSGIVGWVARNKKSAVVLDVSKDDRYYEAFPGTSSELAVPILFNDNLLGAINIESPQVGFFDDEDRRLIEVVANHLAIALSNISSRADLREQAVRDPLTGLFNRHYFNSIIASELSRSDRYERPLSLMMVDVDGFRAVNNKLGHLQGDEVLQNVARMLEKNVRDADRVIRYGGDEFLIFMPETNGQRDAQLVADRLRQEIGSVLEGTGADELGLSLGLSIGIYSRHPRESKTLEEILEEVDQRMYADKRAKNEDRADDYRR
ncbi:diguanylate cyclase [Candidatus Bipolaricaulota bacterium]|nr:diguanylate cyclase [Candidatus Bipolaricaulota bacterium]